MRRHDCRRALLFHAELWGDDSRGVARLRLDRTRAADVPSVERVDVGLPRRPGRAVDRRAARFHSEHPGAARLCRERLAGDGHFLGLHAPGLGVTLVFVSVFVSIYGKQPDARASSTTDTRYDVRMISRDSIALP